MKMIDKYSTYTSHYGGMSENKEESLTNKTRAQQTEVKNIVQMYGMDDLINKWNASEPFYADMTEAVTVNNALELRQKANEYFENLPARARKIFGDNPDLFYEKYSRGDFEGFVENGIMTDEMVDYYTKKIKETKGYYNYEQSNKEVSNNNINDSQANTNMSTNNNKTVENN